jgi:hypothetical protein
MQTEENIRIAILTIATGKYPIFLDGLIDSAENHFMLGHEKEYFVFTDYIEYKNKSTDKVNNIEQRHLGWPYDTMMRFHMFLSIKERLLEFDYVFFLNANMIFERNVGLEILPVEENSYLVGVKHPGFHLGIAIDWAGDLKKIEFPYERNPEISCHIKKGDDLHYFQGCFNGGRSTEWVEMCRCLSEMTDSDISKDLIPIWHDESYLNWYFSKRKVKVLPPVYGLPEQVLERNFSPTFINYSVLCDVNHYIVQRDKSKYGGSDFLRANK